MQASWQPQAAHTCEHPSQFSNPGCTRAEEHRTNAAVRAGTCLRSKDSTSRFWYGRRGRTSPSRSSMANASSWPPSLVASSKALSCSARCATPAGADGDAALSAGGRSVPAVVRGGGRVQSAPERSSSVPTTASGWATATQVSVASAWTLHCAPRRTALTSAARASTSASLCGSVGGCWGRWATASFPNSPRCGWRRGRLGAARPL
jgi:hypothetical protein